MVCILVCATEESGFDTCYIFVHSPMLYWHDARESCQQTYGGDLVVLSTDERFDALRSARLSLGEEERYILYLFSHTHFGNFLF